MIIHLSQQSPDCAYQPTVICSYWSASNTTAGTWSELPAVNPLQSQLDTANQKIVALEKEDNALYANNKVLEAELKVCRK